ncbi:MAG: hypothetical protein ABSB63_22775 [Spirochaetia bacterium]|jgi:hypothetical protein
MKITVEAAARMTKLSVSSVRQISAKLRLGKQEGGKKVFTMAEVKKLEGQKKAPRKAKKAAKSARAAKPAATRKPASAKRASRAPKPVVQKAVKKPVQKKEEPKAEAKAPAVEKRPFWGFLGIGRKQKTKVSIMELQGRK